MSHNGKKHGLFTLKNKRRIPKWLAWCIALLLKSLAWTYRVKIRDDKGFFQSGKPWPVIFAIWHNRLLFPAAIAPKRMLEGSSVLISASRDGEYIATIIRFFGLGVVRGSSSRGGVQALLGLDGELRAGRSIIITLDGPRGPRYTVHPGAVMLAQGNNVPVMPVSVNAKHCWKAKSWDGTQVPWPFSKVELRMGTPVYIGQDSSREEGCAMVAAAMMEITED